MKSFTVTALIFASIAAAGNALFTFGQKKSAITLFTMGKTRG